MKERADEPPKKETQPNFFADVAKLVGAFALLDIGAHFLGNIFRRK